MDTVFQYQIEMNVYDCDHGCSNHGTCNVANNTCSCYDNYGADDCSLTKKPLAENVPTKVNIPPYQTTYFAIEVSQAQALGHIDMKIVVTEDDPAFYPRLLLSPQNPPTDANHFLASPMPLRGSTTVRLPANALKQYYPATWYLGVVSYAYETISISVVLSYEGYCPNDCTNHGACLINTNDYSVTCTCDPGWNGGACDVADSDLPSGNSNVATGTTVALVFVFLFLGIVLGVGIKTKFPGICAKGEGEAFTSDRRVGYSAMGEA